MEKNYKEWIIGLALSALALMVYANTLVNGFVQDDSYIILKNRAFHDGILSLFRAIDTDPTQLLPFYRPLTYMTFFVEKKAHGFDPLFMHGCNVILHAANVFLVYLLGLSVLKGRRAALLAGALFAVHPINAESVNYLSGGRNTMLACFFVLAAFLLHQRSIITNRFILCIAGALLFLAALFSKEMALMLLPVLLGLELRNSWKGGVEARTKAAVRMAPYLPAAGVYLVMRWQTLSAAGIQKSIIPGFGMQKLATLYSIPNFGERMQNNLFILPKYLLTIIWPASLSPRYAMPGDLPLRGVLLAITWGCIVAVAAWIVLRRENRAERFGLIWGVAFWLPISGVVYFSNIVMADRYLYLPAIGIWIAVAGQFDKVIRSRSRMVGSAVAVGAVLILILSAGMTLKRNCDWKDERALFTKMTDLYPDNAYGYYYLGAAYLIPPDMADPQRAEKYLERALALDDSLPSVHTLLGYIRLQSGNFESAAQLLTEALRRNPADGEARINRGTTYENMGRYQDALKDYEFALSTADDEYLPGSREYAARKVKELRR